jgi:glycosidase
VRLRCLPDGHPRIDVVAQQADSRSMLHLHRRLIALRRAHLALTVGRYVPLTAAGGMIAFIRETETERLLIALNLASVPTVWESPASIELERVLLSTHSDAPPLAGRRLALRADEGLVVLLRP